MDHLWRDELLPGAEGLPTSRAPGEIPSCRRIWLASQRDGAEISPGHRQTRATKPLLQWGTLRPCPLQRGLALGSFKPEQIYSVFKAQFVLFSSFTWGRKMKSHLQQSCFRFSKVFSLQGKWMFRAPCPLSKLQAEKWFQPKCSSLQHFSA